MNRRGLEWSVCGPLKRNTEHPPCDLSVLCVLFNGRVGICPSDRPRLVSEGWLSRYFSKAGLVPRERPIMKRFHAVLLVVTLVVMSVLASCASAPPAPTGPQVIADPAAALRVIERNIIAAGGIAGIGMGSSTRQDIAMQKAETEARLKVAQAMQTKIDNLTKKFVEEIGSAATSEVNEAFSSVTKSTTSKTLTGIVSLGDPIVTLETSKDGKKSYVAYVILGVDPKAVNTSIIGEVQKVPNLYERFRATQAYDELQKEIEASTAGK